MPFSTLHGRGGGPRAVAVRRRVFDWLAIAFGLALSGCATGGAVSADAAPAAAPDYAEAANWAVADTDRDRPADVFYIHPTTFRSQLWNQPLDDSATREWTVTSVLNRQVDAFADCCRRYMPFYRQASTRALFEREEGGDAAFALAYEDVRAAFRTYRERHADDRPFILAAHSQGALHGLRLLREEIAGTPNEGLLVAAYLPGIGIPQSAVPIGIAVCEDATQTGCLISWNSFARGADTSAYVARTMAERGDKGAAGDTIVCVNPMSFDVSQPNAGTDDGRGARPGPATPGPLPALVHGKVAAGCEGGVLSVDILPGLPVETLPGGNLHMADIALFWGDIRANSLVRTAAWLQAQAR